MKVSAVVLARVLAFIDAADLIPKGGASLHDLTTEVGKYFRFQKSPRTFEDLDLSKGIEFIDGRFGKRSIGKFVIWPSILVLETQVSTDAGKELIGDILQWGKERLGLDYDPGMITRFGYLSNLSFYSPAPLLSLSPLLERISTRTTEALTEIWKEPIVYEPLEIKVGHDPLTRKWPIAPFQITRRAEHKFSENKYFSEAPLPTDLHVSLLEEYESGILELHRKKKVQ